MPCCSTMVMNVHKILDLLQAILVLVVYGLETAENNTSQPPSTPINNKPTIINPTHCNAHNAHSCTTMPSPSGFAAHETSSVRQPAQPLTTTPQKAHITHTQCTMCCWQGVLFGCVTQLHGCCIKQPHPRYKNSMLKSWRLLCKHETDH